MKTAICENWHAWQGQAHVLLSDESAAKLRYFASWDDLTTWLLLNGHRDAARSINSQVKA